MTAATPGRDGLREQIAALAAANRGLHPSFLADAVMVPVDRALADSRAAVTMVRALHNNDEDPEVCAVCVTYDDLDWVLVPWPCPTIAALNAAASVVDTWVAAHTAEAEQVAALRGRSEQLRSALAWMVGAHYGPGVYVPKHIAAALDPPTEGQT